MTGMFSSTRSAGKGKSDGQPAVQGNREDRVAGVETYGPQYQVRGVEAAVAGNIQYRGKRGMSR